MYGNVMHQVDVLEYGQWEDAIEKITGRTAEEQEASYEWITYDFLMDLGIMVSEPKAPRPVGEPTPPIKSGVPVSETPREKEWTQGRIIREQARLLKKEQELFKREKAMSQKPAREVREIPTSRIKQLPKRDVFYNAEGQAYRGHPILTTLFFLMFLVFMFTNIRC